MHHGERSGDFSKHQAALYAEMLYSSEIPSKSVKEIDDLVAKFASQAKETEGKKGEAHPVCEQKARKEGA